VLRSSTSGGAAETKPPALGFNADPCTQQLDPDGCHNGPDFLCSGNYCINLEAARVAPPESSVLGKLFGLFWFCLFGLVTGMFFVGLVCSTILDREGIRSCPASSGWTQISETAQQKCAAASGAGKAAVFLMQAWQQRGAKWVRVWK
jgi:hypothetical protein